MLIRQNFGTLVIQFNPGHFGIAAAAVVVFASFFYIGIPVHSHNIIIRITLFITNYRFACSDVLLDKELSQDGVGWRNKIV